MADYWLVLAPISKAFIAAGLKMYRLGRECGDGFLLVRNEQGDTTVAEESSSFDM
jgi:hypothetical protein